MLRDMFNDAQHATKLSPLRTLMVYIHLFLFLVCVGRIFQWISFVVYL
jgi:hypothetical protein